VPAVSFPGSFDQLMRHIARLQFGRITFSTFRSRDSGKVFEAGPHWQTQAVYPAAIGRFEGHVRNQRNVLF
jgi:hypothetical protein